MSKFNRTTTPIIKPKYKKPWQDPNYDALREDKKKLFAPITLEEEREMAVTNAKNMFKSFGFRKWMQGMIDQEGNEVKIKKRIRASSNVV